MVVDRTINRQKAQISGCMARTLCLATDQDMATHGQTKLYTEHPYSRFEALWGVYSVLGLLSVTHSVCQEVSAMPCSGFLFLSSLSSLPSFASVSFSIS